MARHASPIAAAELRVVQSRRELREGLRRVGSELSRPPYLAAAAAAAALLGFWLIRRGRTGAVARPLAAALLHHGLALLIARVGSFRRNQRPRLRRD